MTERIQERYRDLASKIANGNYDKELVKLSQELLQDELNEDLMKKVYELWRWELESSCSGKENREKLENITPARFVASYKYDEEKLNFIEENWSRLGLIIKYVKDYAISLEGE